MCVLALSGLANSPAGMSLCTCHMPGIVLTILN